MTIDIRIEQQPPLHALEIARNAPMWKIPKLLGNDFPRIDKHITAQGGSRTGAPYVRYMEIEAIAIEPLTCVRTIHKGPYQKVGDTYNEVVDWAEANNLQLANHTMENYINDPTTVAKEDIETLILIPVVSGPVSTEDSAE